MNNPRTRKIKNGFTLIEVIIYLALFAMLMTGALTAAYNIFEGSGRSQSRAMLNEEGEFLLAKISWVLSGVRAVDSPLSNSSSNVLSVSKWDSSLPSPIVVTVSGSDLILSRGTNPPQAIDNSNVWINNLLFSRTTAPGSGIDPEKVEVSFTLFTRTLNGQVMSQNFSDTVYLRK